MSYFSQMVALVIHNFVSAATGIALAAALVRGIVRHTAQTIGNFWTDLVRSTYYLLLPIAFVFAVFLVSQGVVQNFHPYTTANVVQPTAGGDDPIDPARTVCLTGSDQDDRHERRRILKRQFRASV